MRGIKIWSLVKVMKMLTVLVKNNHFRILELNQLFATICECSWKKKRLNLSRNRVMRLVSSCNFLSSCVVALKLSSLHWNNFEKQKPNSHFREEGFSPFVLKISISRKLSLFQLYDSLSNKLLCKTGFISGNSDLALDANYGASCWYHSYFR